MRILLVSSRYPWPPWRGNQVRTVQWLQALAEHEVTLACPVPAGVRPDMSAATVVGLPAGPAGRVVGLLRAAVRGRPLQEGLYDVPGVRRALANALRAAPWDVVAVQMVRCAWAAEVVRRCAPAAAIVFDAIDSMGLHFEQAASSAASWKMSAYRIEAARCRRRERWLAAAAALTTAVAGRDIESLAVPVGRARVVAVAGRRQEVRRADDPDPVVLLSGNLGYRPTVEAATWFADQVWPELRRRVPGARWVLAGARPARAVRRLAAIEGVTLHADVPELGAYLAEARVAVAPMAGGSGVPMKVLEAMAAGVPVVAHPWAGAGLTDGARAAVIEAARTEDWVGQLCRLLTQPAAARELGDRGRDAWRRHYHPDVVAEQVRSVISDAASSGRT